MKRSPRPVKISKPGRFEVPLVELRDRLTALAPPKMWGLGGTLDFARSEPDAVGLWIDEPWAELSAKDLRASPTKVAAAVFTRPIRTPRSLVLRPRDLFGFDLERDQFAFVFLGPVRARDVCMVPDKVAVFARGLTVNRVASFDGADAHTTVAGHLRAPYVISGVGGGGVHLEPGTKVGIKEYARHVYGLPKGTTATRRASLLAMWPFLGKEAVEDEEAWEIVNELIDSGRELPKKNALRKEATPRANEVKGKTFVFAGRLASRYITVRDLVRTVDLNGGTVARQVTATVDYLVIGDARSALLGQGPKLDAQRKAEACLLYTSRCV